MSVENILAAPATIRSFDGANINDQVKFRGAPGAPDCNGAAGYNEYVEFINGVFSIYDNDTGTLRARVSNQEFWTKAGIPSFGNIVDPRIVFVPNAGKRGNGQFLAMQLDLGHRVHFAVTDPNDSIPDPSIGKWKGASFDLPGNDFIMFGFDVSNIYLTSQIAVGKTAEEAGKADEHGQDGLGAPFDRQSQIVCIPKTAALAYPPQLGPENIKIFPPLDPEKYGTGLYPVTILNGIGQNYETFIGIDRVSKRNLTYVLMSIEQQVLVSHATISVPAFVPLEIYSRFSQPSSYKSVLYAVDFMPTTVYSDFNYIWAAHTVQTHGEQRLGIRWYRLRYDQVSRQPVLDATGELSDGVYDYCNPSIYSFGADDYTVISFTRSGLNTPVNPNDPKCGNVGSYVAFLNGNKPQEAPIIVPIKAGLAPDYLAPNGNRWGDYTTLCKDPSPRYPRRIWSINQYVTAGGDTNTSKWSDVIACIDVATLE